MFGLSKRPFESRGTWRPFSALTESVFSEEFVASLYSESSDSWVTIASDDNDDDDDDEDEFFSTISGSFEEFFEAGVFSNILEEGSRVIAEVDGEARLARVISWVARGYSALHSEDTSWLPQDEEDSGLSEDRDVGRKRLEKWMKVMEVRKRKRERELRKERWRKPWTVIMNLVNRCSHEPISPSVNSEIRRSCASDVEKVKKGNKGFRARRRIMNVFRRVDKPVESAIASKRFLIE